MFCFESIVGLVLTFLAVILSRKIFHNFWSNRGKLPLPPSPPKWPILGHIPLFFHSKQVELTKHLSSKYGDVVHLQVGPQCLILLSSWKAMKEAFVTQKIMNKPTDTLQAKINMNEGILLSNGATWKEHRQFTATWLKNLGVGKKIIERSIITEIDELCAAFKDLNGAVFNPKPLLTPSILNVIWTVTAGKRFLLDDVELAELLKLVNRNVQISARFSVVALMPWLRFVPWIGKHYWEIKSNAKAIKRFLQNTLDDKKKDLDVHADVTDLTREYLKQAEKDKQSGKLDSTFTDSQITRNITDLFIAGSDTTVTTITWALLILAAHPEYQKRLQDEIDEVIGQAGIPSMSHRSSLPFTEAVIAEVQRFASIVPVVQHLSPTESEVNGYRIPAGSLVMVNLHQILKDPSVWKEPDVFNPDRFLDAGGKLSIPEYFVPFSAGPRVCLGESLAKMELFLFIVSFFQRFTFKLADGEKWIYDPLDGAVMGPKSSNICAISR